jgi:hypothetical protein
VSTWLVSAIVAGVVLLGLVARMPGLGDPPVDFHPTRQYFDLLLTRDVAVDLGMSVPNNERAAVDAARVEPIEPPVLPVLVGTIWRFFGESTFVARLSCVLAWCGAGVLLIGALRSTTTIPSALLAGATFLGLPFGIAASRSYQPDVLMVALLAAGLWALTKSSAGMRWRVAAICCLAAAAFTKNVALFFVLPLLLAASTGKSRVLPWRQAALGAVVAIAPAAGWWAYGSLWHSFLDGQVAAKIMPQLLHTWSYWQSWLTMIRRVVPWPVLILALMGTVSRGRTMLGRCNLALFAGYALFGLVFTYHYATHSYYHLPLLLPVAVGVGLFADTLWIWTRGWFVVRAAVVSTVIFLVSAPALIAVFASKDSSGLAGDLSLAFGTARAPAYLRDEAAVAEEVGRLTDHDPDLVLAGDAYGYPLEFHGRVAGVGWPYPIDRFAASLRGDSVPSGQSLLCGMLVDDPNRRFVITELGRLPFDEELVNLLNAGELVSYSENRFAIFDLSPLSSGVDPVCSRHVSDAT